MEDQPIKETVLSVQEIAHAIRRIAINTLMLG